MDSPTVPPVGRRHCLGRALAAALCASLWAACTPPPQPEPPPELTKDDGQSAGWVGYAYAIGTRSPSEPVLRVVERLSLRPVVAVRTPELTLQGGRLEQGLPGAEHLSQWYALRLRAWVAVLEGGPVEFRLISSDGSRLLVGGKLVVDNDGLHEPRAVTGSLELERGWHDVRVDYFRGTGPGVLKLEWKRPGDQDFTPIAARYVGRPDSLDPLYVGVSRPTPQERDGKAFMQYGDLGEVTMDVPLSRLSELRQITVRVNGPLQGGQSWTVPVRPPGGVPPPGGVSQMIDYTSGGQACLTAANAYSESLRGRCQRVYCVNGPDSDHHGVAVREFARCIRCNGIPIFRPWSGAVSAIAADWAGWFMEQIAPSLDADTDIQANQMGSTQANIGFFRGADADLNELYYPWEVQLGLTNRVGRCEQAPFPVVPDFQALQPGVDDVLVGQALPVSISPQEWPRLLPEVSLNVRVQSTQTGINAQSTEPRLLVFPHGTASLPLSDLPPGTYSAVAWVPDTLSDSEPATFTVRCPPGQVYDAPRRQCFCQPGVQAAGSCAP